MLFSILPGLRQLRAPLAAGFVWLVAGWLALAGPIPLPDEARSGIFRDIYDLIAAAGEAGAVAAAVFAAYLLGIISVRATTVLLALPAWIRRNGSGIQSNLQLPHPSTAGREALHDVVLNHLAKRSETDGVLQNKLDETAKVCGGLRDLDGPGVRSSLLAIRLDIESYCDDLEQDLPNMPLRLLGDDTERGVYGEFDRRRAEAEFRAAVVLPLAALAVVVAARASPWFLLALALPVILLRDAYRTFTDAADVLAASLRAGSPQVSSPALDPIRAGPLRERPYQKWIEAAAGLGYPGALREVAERAEGADEKRAGYLAAAAAGDPKAMVWIAGRLHDEGSPDAESWYERAAAESEPVALRIRELRVTLDAIELTDVKRAFAGVATAMPRAATALLRHARPADKTDARTAESWYLEAVKARVPGARELYVRHLHDAGSHAAADEIERTYGGATATPALRDQ